MGNPTVAVRDDAHGDRNQTADAPTGGWRAYLRSVGPGFVTGASDDDPSGVATYSQAGAQRRYDLAWLSLFTLPLAAAVQEICDRTALATGRTLSDVAARRFRKARPILVALAVALIGANVLNIAADLVAVGEGMHLLHAGPVLAWSLIAGALVTVFVVSGSFGVISRVFKLLALVLLSYVVVLFVAGADWSLVWRGLLVPHLDRSSDTIALVVAVLGTTISPYLFFWQGTHRVEDLREDPEGGDRAVGLRHWSRRRARFKLRSSRLDVFGGITFSNLVMFAIIVTTGATIGSSRGSHEISSAAQAAEALRPIAGSAAGTLFAIGFISTGMLAVPVLAGAGAAALTGVFGGETGFSRSPRRAPLFYALVGAGTIGGTALTLLHVNPVHLLVFSAVINGVVAAPFLVLIMLVSSDRQVMREHRNGALASGLGWLTTAVMAAASIAYFLTA